jgi:hypothetical protein
VEDAIASADVRQERIAKSLAFSRSLHQAGDVDDIQVRWNFAAMKSERKLKIQIAPKMLIARQFGVLFLSRIARHNEAWN